MGSVSYLLNQKKHDNTARILDGDPAVTKAIIRSMRQKQKVCMGVLSFEESPQELTEIEKAKIMKSFEAMLLPGMQGDYNILWIEHSDKINKETGERRLELNFVIPKLNLNTQKAFNPYYYKVDHERKALWQDLTNHEYELSDPNAQKRLISFDETPHKLDKPKLLANEKLNDFLLDLLEQGKEGEELFQALEEQGYQITSKRQNGNFSIKTPGEAGRAPKVNLKEYYENIRNQHHERTITRSSQYDERVGKLNKLIDRKLQSISKSNRKLQEPRANRRGLDKISEETKQVASTAGTEIYSNNGSNDYSDRLDDLPSISDQERARISEPANSRNEPKRRGATKSEPTTYKVGNEWEYLENKFRWQRLSSENLKRAEKRRAKAEADRKILKVDEWIKTPTSIFSYKLEKLKEQPRSILEIIEAKEERHRKWERNQEIEKIKSAERARERQEKKDQEEYEKNKKLARQAFEKEKPQLEKKYNEEKEKKRVNVIRKEKSRGGGFGFGR